MHAYVCWHWTHRTDLSRRDASLASLKKAQHARTRATALLRFLLHAGHSFLWLANTKARCSRGKQAAGENASLGRIASAGCECLYRLCHKVSLDTSLNDATSRRPKKHGADHKRLATAEAQIAKEISSDHSNGARGQLSPQIAVPPCCPGKFLLRSDTHVGLWRSCRNSSQTFASRSISMRAMSARLTCCEEATAILPGCAAAGAPVGVASPGRASGDGARVTRSARCASALMICAHRVKKRGSQASGRGPRAQGHPLAGRRHSPSSIAQGRLTFQQLPECCGLHSSSR